MITDFSQNSWPYLGLKLPCDPHDHASLQTQCFFFPIGHGLHPHNTCFSCAMVYTHAMTVFHYSQVTPMHCLFSSNYFVDFIYDRMYLSTTYAGFIDVQSNILHYRRKIVNSNPLNCAKKLTLCDTLIMQRCKVSAFICLHLDHCSNKEKERKKERKKEQWIEEIKNLFTRSFAMIFWLLSDTIQKSLSSSRHSKRIEIWWDKKILL